MYIINKCSGIFLVFISDYNRHRERLHRLWPVFISPSLREVKGGHSLQSANHGLRICMNAAALRRAAPPWAKYRPTFTSHNDRSTLTGHGLLASLHRKLSENSKNISDYKKGKWIELLSWFYKFFIKWQQNQQLWTFLLPNLVKIWGISHQLTVKYIFRAVQWCT